MKKLLLIALTALLIASGAWAQETIFDDGFESGNVSAWSDSQGFTEFIGVFISSDQFFGDFGGLAVGDVICQNLGTAAIPGSGPWRAWLSDSTTDARDRIPQPSGGGAYIQANGDPGADFIANDLADLTDGTLGWPIVFDENGNDPTGRPEFAWTGTNGDGRAATNRCLDWLTDSDMSRGVIGDSVMVDDRWTNAFSSEFCHREYSLYCFGALP